jgi:hypothetical protein
MRKHIFCPMPPSDKRHSIPLLEGARVSPACPSHKGNSKKNVSMEHWWNGHDGLKPMYSETDLPQLHFAHHKFQIAGPQAPKTQKRCWYHHATQRNLSTCREVLGFYSAEHEGHFFCVFLNHGFVVPTLSILLLFNKFLR